ncbi:MazG-like family protein [Ligilactobacillus sp. LYQ139]|uniref:MazG-like family protein n=1 Tax=Ligilactobacillus sp. LYQ139 TaxID=3378800 RepID=UPI003852D1C6
MTFEEFTKNVIKWADKRHLLQTEVNEIFSQDELNALMQSNQLLKFHEECGELTEDYLKGNDAHLMDSFGDVLVTLVIFAKQRNIPLNKCWENAWRHIANRKGKTVNGTFVKEADLHNKEVK